jgi:hypothetical protein
MTDDYKNILSSMKNESYYDNEDVLIEIMGDINRYNKIFKFLEKFHSNPVWTLIREKAGGSLDNLDNYVQVVVSIPSRFNLTESSEYARNLNNSAKNSPELRNIIDGLIECC